MNELEKRILLGTKAESDRLAELGERWRRDPDARPDPRTSTGLREIMAVEALRTHGVRIDLAGWCLIGHGDAARKAAQRALARLEAAGLVTPSGYWGERLTHARLTQKGLELAESLAAALANA